MDQLAIERVFKRGPAKRFSIGSKAALCKAFAIGKWMKMVDAVHCQLAAVLSWIQGCGLLFTP